jgi:hypothetical protein
MLYTVHVDSDVHGLETLMQLSCIHRLQVVLAVVYSLKALDIACWHSADGIGAQRGGEIIYLLYAAAMDSNLHSFILSCTSAAIPWS